MDGSTVMSVMAAAEKMKTSRAEVKRLMKSGVLEVAERNTGVPGVTERSVLDFIGEARGDIEKNRRGRRPNLWSVEDACCYLDVDEEALYRLAEQGEVEFYDEENLKEATVKMYKKKRDSQEARVVHDETKHTEQSVEPVEAGEDEQNSGADTECGTQGNEATGDDEPEDASKSDETEAESDIDAVMAQLFPGICDLTAFVEKAQRAQRRFSQQELKEVAAYAYMRGKLAVYERMQSFTRV